MDKIKKNSITHGFNFMAISAMKQLKRFPIPFYSKTKNDRSTRRAENSGTSKKGHFSVIVLENGKPKKFFVALGYLRYPPFIKLVHEAEKEYGFNQKGVLVIPCEASELERIL
ncbi:auxin-responsive protein SAUR72-like [Hibiscus syriacus]|uniref:auxin-responsive protein SAUR72-like n=1 Tax=Hibiscus syriacus TaxID=106335 RepID=UPI001921D3A8|nr:auxin-responsive protein SAUR72-like [Hibiscus syriacus]